MGTTLNDTPSANRTHIAFFGKMNSGKSSLVNALANQQISIVSEVGGTTTDLVKKPMEIHGIGPCVLIDTAGFDDAGALGESRVALAKQAAKQADLAVLVFSAETAVDTAAGSGTETEADTAACSGKETETVAAAGSGTETEAVAAAGSGTETEAAAVSGTETEADTAAGSGTETEAVAAAVSGTEKFAVEKRWYDLLQKRDTPVVFVISKTDISTQTQHLAEQIRQVFQKSPLLVSAVTKDGIEDLKNALVFAAAEQNQEAERLITGDLVRKEDLVMLVMPQDIQAPKGRLILPQVQTLRELLDKKCLTMCVTTDQFEQALAALKQPPKLIITDSQVFKTIYDKKPKQSSLTSFSTLFAAYKGDIGYFVRGAQTIGMLTGQDKVLIAECCTHAPLDEDIGREKLPRLLRKKAGEGLRIDIVSGTDFPKDLSEYRLIIQCGACMFNRKYVMSRVEAAREQQIPMTNYGVAIAYLGGILDQVALPEIHDQK